MAPGRFRGHEALKQKDIVRHHALIFRADSELLRIAMETIAFMRASAGIAMRRRSYLSSDQVRVINVVVAAEYSLK